MKGMSERVREDENGSTYIECDCGLSLYRESTNDIECSCGSLYNYMGQKLMSDSDWAQEYS